MAKILKSLLEPIADLDGIPFPRPGGTAPCTIGWYIGDILSKSSLSDPVRAIEVALKLRSTDKAMIDDSDMALINQAIDQVRPLNVIVKTLRDVLNAAEDGEFSTQ